jgi:hypothetical protein
MHTIESTYPATTLPNLASTEGSPRAGGKLRIAHRITTGTFAALIALSGTAFLVGPAPVVEGIRRLGYPPYFTPLLGIAKLLGVAVLLAPRARILREWAYAGFTFLLIAAISSHTLSKDGVAHAVPAIVCLGLLLASYATRRSAAETSTGIRQVPASGLEARGFWRSAPWLARLALVPPVFIFLAVASRNLSDPVSASAALGISLATPEAITTTRIGFGAFPLAFALFLAACLVSGRRLLTGLALAATVTAVATVVRALGIALDGTAAQSVKLLHAELGLLAVLVAGLAVETGRRFRQRRA